MIFTKECKIASQPGTLLPTLVLLIGALVYLVLCEISIRRTPGDVPYVYWPMFRESWIIAAIIFSVWTKPGWIGRISICVYALTTALVHASCVRSVADGEGWMIPSSDNDVLEHSANFIVYGFLNLLETLFFFVVIRVAVAEVMVFGVHVRAAFQILMTCSVITCAFISPQFYRNWILIPAQSSGIQRANNDWGQGNAKVLAIDETSDWHADGVNFDSVFDHQTGLKVLTMTGSNDSDAFEQDAYNVQIQKLYNANGRPKWAHQFLPDGDLIAALSSTSLRQIKTFPFRVNAAVVLNSASNIAANDGTSCQYGSGDPPMPVFVGDDPADPQVQFVRFGNERVAVCTPSGVIENAQRN